MSAATEHQPADLMSEPDGPPELPMPCPEVRHLGRREGILGWAVGWLAGMILAAGALAALLIR